MLQFRHFIFLIPACIIVGACAVSPKRIIKNGSVKTTRGLVSADVYKPSDYLIEYKRSEKIGIQITYTGCGGFNIARNGTSIVIDPYVTYLGPLKGLGVCKAKTDTDQMDLTFGGLYQDSKNEILSVLVSHSHYDHLMDVPYFFNKFADSTKARIYCSQSGKNMINGVGTISNSNCVVIDHLASDSDVLREQFFLLPDSSIRITPILTDHAPHFKVGNCTVNAHHGESKPKKRYKTPTSKSRAGWWKLGKTFAYVIDYLTPKKDVEFRIYIQSSAAGQGVGWIPPELKNENEGKVDLAILGIASFGYVDHYPESLLGHLNPEKLIICHWEDFFRDYEKKREREKGKEREKNLRLTNIKKGIRRVNLVYPYQLEKDGKEQFTLPYLGVTISLD